MREELSKLCVRLRTEGKSVMSDIYNLTSSHVYGLIYQVVNDDKKASHVLKAVYCRLWDQKDEFHKKTLDPLDWLRATAHRYAMDYKTKKVILDGTPSVSQKNDPNETLNFSTLNLSENEKVLFKQAYLQDESVSEIAAKHNQSEDHISRVLENINQKIKRVGN